MTPIFYFGKSSGLSAKSAGDQILTFAAKLFGK
jgi:hypothetical protein